MIRLASLLILFVFTLLVPGSPASAQLVVVVNECSTSTPLGPIGADGTDALQDTIDVTDTVIIDDARVVFQMTHAFVGDLIVDLQSPAVVTVRLHDGGGGSDDNIDVIYNDDGLFNGARYDCACDMQPSGPGTMADFDGTASQGAWVLDVTDTFPTSGGGTLDAWCVQLLSDTPEPFIRGDVDGDGIFNGLVDGVAALSYQFVPGSTAPPCLSAADTDDNGTFNGIIDAAICLNFQFVPGSPPPAAPYPACGEDPTLDVLGCNTPSACP